MRVIAVAVDFSYEVKHHTVPRRKTYNARREKAAPRKSGRTVWNRGCVRFINSTVHRRETTVSLVLREKAWEQYETAVRSYGAA